MSADILNVKLICTQPDLLDVLSKSVFNPTPERLLTCAESYQNNADVEVYAYREDEKFIGVIAFEISKSTATILNISVKTSNQHKGIGSQLIDYIFKKFNIIRILAETDDDAIGFYKKYGFYIMGTQNKFGVPRYSCVCENTVYHYNSLIDENNDPVHDPQPLKEYMDKWDGQAFIDELQLSKDKSVLEIGVGTGRLAVKVAPECGSFTGIDISPKTIERSKENLAEYSNVTLICGDFTMHEFDRHFDIIYSSLTFMHIENKSEAINKIAGLVAPGGRFVLSIDKDKNEYIDLGSRKIKVFPDNPDDIRNCIKAAGLKLEKQFETEFAYIFAMNK